MSSFGLSKQKKSKQPTVPLWPALFFSILLRCRRNLQFFFEKQTCHRHVLTAGKGLATAWEMDYVKSYQSAIFFQKDLFFFHV